MATSPKKIFTRPGTKPAAPTEPAVPEDEPAAVPDPPERPKLKFTRPTQVKVTEQAGRGYSGQARGAAAAAGTVMVGSKSRKQPSAAGHDSKD